MSGAVGEQISSLPTLRRTAGSAETPPVAPRLVPDAGQGNRLADS